MFLASLQPVRYIHLFIDVPQSFSTTAWLRYQYRSSIFYVTFFFHIFTLLLNLLSVCLAAWSIVCAHSSRSSVHSTWDYRSYVVMLQVDLLNNPWEISWGRILKICWALRHICLIRPQEFSNTQPHPPPHFTYIWKKSTKSRLLWPPLFTKFQVIANPPPLIPPPL